MAVQPFLIQRQPKEREEPKKTPLDYLLIGLDVANKGFGIAANYQTIQNAQVNRETSLQEQKLNEIKLLDAKRNANLKATGVENVDLAKNDIVPGPVRPEGGREVTINKGFEGEKPINQTAYIMPKQDSEKSVLLKDIETVDPKTGISYSATFNPKTGEVKTSQFATKIPSRESGKNFDKISVLDEESGKSYVALFNKNTGEIKKTNVLASSDKDTKGLKPLGAEEKKRLDNINEGLRSLDDMEESIKSGKWTISPDDNEYTEAQRRFVDAKVRIQSGGSATDDEQKMYRDMTPRPQNSPEIQKRKLEKQRESFLAARKTILNPEENNSDYKTSKNIEPTSEDQQAFEWASKNILSPDSKTAQKARAILSDTPAAQLARKPNTNQPPSSFGGGAPMTGFRGR